MVDGDIRSVKYGEEFLKRFDFNIIIYNYNERTHSQNPIGHSGIHIIAYIKDIYHLRLVYYENYIEFSISDESRKYLHGKIPFDKLTNEHFIYFENLVIYLSQFESFIKKCKAGFGPDLPTEFIREERLKNILN